MKKVIFTATALLASLYAGFALADDIENLGAALYKDKNLSINRNQSCMTCHHPSAGFADPVNLRDPVEYPVSAGSIEGEFGGRNAPSSAYAGFSPIFHLDDEIGGYVGGMFWDGRATGETLGDPLAEQALGPFQNPVEMAMTPATVVEAVSVSNYVNLFLVAFPNTDFSDVETTFNNIGRAIAAYERSTTAVTRFSSKFDEFWTACQSKGIDINTIDTTTNLATLPSGILTSTQLQGLAIFNDTKKGNCASCHSTTDVTYGETPPVFTNFTYHNIGIPTNPRVEELSGVAPPDLGLGGVLEDQDEYGKFKVPTLRNIAKTAPYGHNGYFPTLDGIVNFHNTRDVAAWEDEEVSTNLVPTEVLGNLGLTPQEEWQLVAFLKALTDQR